MNQSTIESTEPLALHGGSPSVTEATGLRHRWGAPELQQLEAAARQDSLFYWNGPQTHLLIERFRRHYPLTYVMPASSGTAAIHIAVAAAGVGPGDEVITSPITDMGTAIGILYQQGVPVFADLDPRTYNLDPESVRRSITPRTKAILAVHLAGNPCALQELKDIADEHDLVLIEDCAQAWGAEYRVTPVGTVGHIGCWSLNDYKHISCGDGGLVASNDERFGPLLQRFGDKAYDRSGGPRLPAVLAPNYRISEPQSAVAAAQMDRMPAITEKFARVGRRLNQMLDEIPGILPPVAHEADRWTCWFYMLRVDEARLGCTRAEFVEALRAEGIPASAGYIACTLYQYPVFAQHNFFAGRWPVKELGLTQMDYTQVHCPVAEEILDTSVVIQVDETRSEAWASQVGHGVQKVAAHFAPAGYPQLARTTFS